MNRSQGAAVAVAAAVVAVGLVGAATAFGVPGASPSNPTPTESPPSSDTPATEAETRPAFDGDEPLTLEAAPDQAIAGDTTLDAGEEMTVRLRSDDAENPFLISTTATVGGDGSFTATVDLSNVEPGTEATVVVSHDGAELLNATAEVVAPATPYETPTPTPSVASLEYEGEAITLESAPDQVVSGSSTLDEGTEVTVRMRASGESPFLKQQVTTVDADGSFAATFNLSGVPATDDVTVTLRVDGERVETVEATIEESA